jgi:E3 ubiquitin-protein ligase RNF5
MDGEPPPDDGLGRFECNVCLEDVREPIVTQCGHLYCWPCLYRWLNTGHSTCPMCKAGISEENVIPLFIRGSSEDPRGKVDVPNRPSAHRPVPGPPGGAAATGGTPNVQGSTFGFFPSLFGLQFQNFLEPDTATGAGAADEQATHSFLSKTLWAIGSVTVFCLVIF